MRYLTEILVLISIFVVYAASQTIICYDCDPVTTSNIEECKYPVEHNAKVANCQPKDNTTTPLCMSAYVQHPTNTNYSGITRGCVLKPIEISNNSTDICEWFRGVQSNVTLKSCVPCTETRCNSVLLFEDGTSSASTIYHYSFVAFINIVFVILLRQ